MSRARAFCFTINNPTADDEAELTALADDVSYIIVGREKGAQGTTHFQGYVYFTDAKTFTSVKKKLSRAHIEVTKGSPLDNLVYCSKEGDIYLTKGTLPKQGARSDIERVVEQLREGCNMQTITNTARSLQSVKMAEVWLKYNEKPRDFMPTVRWFHGSAGAGKSKVAVEWLGDDYFAPISYKWWEGYDAHECVLLDDIRGDFCKYHEMLRILDRYSYRVECKGGSRQLLARKIAITSPYRPELLWKTVEDKRQLLRRIEKVILVGDPVERQPDLDVDPFLGENV